MALAREGTTPLRLARGEFPSGGPSWCGEPLAFVPPLSGAPPVHGPRATAVGRKLEPMRACAECSPGHEEKKTPNFLQRPELDMSLQKVGRFFSFPSVLDSSS